eukprot:GFUD01066883.1.p1 GENE.GFUD01066883.1~~GFUD01066883.1.p1  ORF type:complete len:112 (+),score=34.76 GFUD01066883.1:22-336(+)
MTANFEKQKRKLFEDLFLENNGPVLEERRFFQMETEVEEVFRQEAVEMTKPCGQFQKRKQEDAKNMKIEEKKPYISPDNISIDQLPLNKRRKLKSLLELDKDKK